jgi:hypothetical protein
MYFTNCKVRIIVNEKLNLFQRISWWFKELLIQSSINNKPCNGVTIEEVLISNGLLKNGEYLMHLSTYPQKYEVRNKKKDKDKERIINKDKLLNKDKKYFKQNNSTFSYYDKIKYELNNKENKNNPKEKKINKTKKNALA